MTDNRLDKIRAREQAATKGPWAVAHGNVICPITQNDGHPRPVSDARELVDQCAVALEQNEANKRVFMTAAYDTLVERVNAHANQRYREGVKAQQSATVEALRNTKENYVSVNHALEIVVNSTAALLKDNNETTI